jgi:hypothetical protein
MNQSKMLAGFFGLLLTFGTALSPFAQQDRGEIVILDQQREEICWYQGSHALLMGISNYTNGWSPLPSIPGEVDQVEEMLAEQSFQVIKYLDLNAEQLKKVFEDFGADFGYGERNRNNRLLFFFSGHGYSYPNDSRGYIVPTDAPRPDDDQNFCHKALSMDQIITWAREIRAKHVLYIFDSCFSGTVFEVRGPDDLPPHINRLTAEPVRMFIKHRYHLAHNVIRHLIQVTQPHLRLAPKFLDQSKSLRHGVPKKPPSRCPIGFRGYFFFPIQMIVLPQVLTFKFMRFSKFPMLSQ